VQSVPGSCWCTYAGCKPTAPLPVRFRYRVVLQFPRLYSSMTTLADVPWPSCRAVGLLNTCGRLVAHQPVTSDSVPWFLSCSQPRCFLRHLRQATPKTAQIATQSGVSEPPHRKTAGYQE